MSFKVFSLQAVGVARGSATVPPEVIEACKELPDAAFDGPTAQLPGVVYDEETKQIVHSAAIPRWAMIAVLMAIDEYERARKSLDITIAAETQKLRTAAKFMRESAGTYSAEELLASTCAVQATFSVTSSNSRSHLPATVLMRLDTPPAPPPAIATE